MLTKAKDLVRPFSEFYPRGCLEIEKYLIPLKSDINEISRCDESK
jgi:hypothetical protein